MVFCDMVERSLWSCGRFKRVPEVGVCGDLTASTYAGPGLHHFVHTWEPDALSEQALGCWSSHVTLMCQFDHALPETTDILAWVYVGYDYPVLSQDQPMEDEHTVGVWKQNLACVLL